MFNVETMVRQLTERVIVVLSQIVGDAGELRVDVRAAQLLRAHFFSRRGLHERRAAQKNRARPLDDDGLVRHRRNVRTAGRAGAHDSRDLRDALGRQSRLIEENSPEMFAVRKHLRLQRQERAAGVDEIDARQVVLERDLLRAKMLFDGHRVVGAAFDRGVVRDDHDVPAGDARDAGDDARTRRLVVVDAEARQRRELEEREPGSIRRSMRSRTGSLPCSRWRWTYFGAAAFARCRRRARATRQRAAACDRGSP